MCEKTGNMYLLLQYLQEANTYYYRHIQKYSSKGVLRVGAGNRGQVERNGSTLWSSLVMNCVSCWVKELLNKTWLAVEALYFNFIGQIPCIAHEYHTCNISRSMGQEGGAEVPSEYQRQ